jgi:hypothetical protein
MYTRLMLIQNKFIELGELLSNNKFIGKLLCVLLRRPRWEDYVSSLKTIQGINATFTMDELYALLQYFKEKLKQGREHL